MPNKHKHQKGTAKAKVARRTASGQKAHAPAHGLARFWQIVHRHKVWSTFAVLLTGGLIALAVYFYPRYYAPGPHLPSPPLKSLAGSRGVELGVLAHNDWLLRRPFDDVLDSQFAMITSDKELHWDKMRPAPNEYNFAPLDKLVDYASEHHMTVQAHHLIWGEDDSLPKWLKNGGYSQVQLYDFMHQDISTVVGHYKGKISEWTVVNEPFTRTRHMYGMDNWWGDHLGGGTEYIDKAFTWAHEADPRAQLILNDFNDETEGTISNDMYSYMASAKARGVPISGIGMQMHIDASQPPDKNAVVQNMQRFGALGYKVYITEFDISTMTVKGSAAYKAQLDARITTDVVQGCVEAKNCISLTVFGITDRKNVIPSPHSRNRDNLFTTTYQPKPAFYTFRDAWSAK